MARGYSLRAPRLRPLGKGLGVNTPKSKPTIRYPVHKSKATEMVQGIDGTFISELVPPEYQTVLGVIVSRWAHLEEIMIMLLGILLSESPDSPARQIFRSVNSTQARIAIIRSLLEESPLNRNKGPEFDEVINEFESLTIERNNYVHGQWFTNQDTGAVSRADPEVARFV